ncbi:MAG: class C sortase [Oscillospiraceae bacterium]|nr:class C sortase [Oscillospiraceae bacterium]
MQWKAGLESTKKKKTTPIELPSDELSVDDLSVEMPKKKKKSRSTGILVGILILGLAIAIYPTFSDWWNTRVQTRAVIDYDESVSTIDENEYEAYFEAAEAYNEAVRELGSSYAIVNYDELEGYEDLLDVTGTGIMGYITIEKINVMLPIYHGTSSAVLQAGAGHLEGTSLPIGGESTHSVISAHRGLPSASLFTNLDQLEIGDTFTITVLNEVLTYEVDQITIVEPTELEDIYIVDGQDYCTLMTCTPYGVNTHRLLVRGKRIATDAVKKTIKVTAEAYKIDSVIVAVCVAIPLIIILFILISLPVRKKKR